MSEKIARPTWCDETVVDHAMAIPDFEELLELTSEVCLNNPNRVSSYVASFKNSRPPAAEQDLLRRLGLKGLQVAADFKNNGASGYLTTVSEADLSVLSADSPVYDPTRFSGELDPVVQAKIEALGKSILDEAFLCLGDMALEKVDQWKNATTFEEEIELSGWLIKRVMGIRDKNLKDEEPVQEEGRESDYGPDRIFHPMRLSPKLIGVYPDINATPTCLGVSILVASFLEKLGLPYMHCGVAQSLSQAAREDYELLLSCADKMAASIGSTIPDILRVSIDATVANSKRKRREDISYHAAVIVKPTHGNWIMIDPNFNNNSIVEDSVASNINDIYEDLREFNQFLPGTELMFRNPWYLSVPYLVIAFDRLKGHSKDPTEIDNFLLNVETTSLPELAEMFIDPLIFGATEDETVAKYQDFLKNWASDLTINDDEETTGQLFDIAKTDIIGDYVFREAKTKGLDYCLQRCKTDAAYRQRRVEDLKLAPIYFIARIAGVMTNMIIDSDQAREHRVMEMGLPVYRIGASVLNDFAVNTGDTLPASFWLTYWPSQVSVTEHLPDPANAATPPMLHNHIGCTNQSRLRYEKSYGIIQEFLEQTSKDGA